ncbi:coiled-coil domain-containing protein [Zavarzinella formosa]|uniref:hypothetical protein n=1 Tax=Zavarzinella formosa TaxID=360055 RepID=UPI0002DB5A41|nr:hypothetical protein [Zavarzinella formosa]
MNQLVVLEQLKPLDIFTPQGTSDILDKIKIEARSHVLDISTDKGREQIRSLAYTIARSKTLLDEMGKELVAEQKKQLALVDGERKRIRDDLDALKDEIRAPLTEWENAEKQRVEGHEQALKAFDSLIRFDTPHPASVEVQNRQKAMDAANSRDWQEFGNRAQLAYDAARQALSDTLQSSQKYESELAELERLRREEADRKAREREELIKAEAATKAKAEAEAKARKEAEAEAARVKAEQEKAEQERQRIQKEKEDAESRAKKAEADRLAAILKSAADSKAAAEKAERDRAEAEEKAAADAKAAAEKAELEKAAAVQAERDRAEAVRKAEAEAAAKREADRKHRAKVNNEALEALNAVMTGDGLLSAGAAAKAIVEAIAKGMIPHVKINY